MVYLESFTFPDDDREASFCMAEKRKCYTSFYPFKVLSRRRLERIDLSRSPSSTAATARASRPRST